MFHEQFKLTEREKNGLLQMCIFAVKIYLKHRQNLRWQRLLQAMTKSFSNQFKNMPALTMHYQQLFYLSFVHICGIYPASKQLVALVFFDQSLSVGTKS